MKALEGLVAVRCSGCRRRFGWSRRSIDGVFCSPYCAQATPTGGNELRDDVVCMLDRLGKTTVQIAVELDMTHQRVSQILHRRGLR